ncbi:hypothetical protein KIW84_076932 [Lathyrus oleraceus]|uniref:Reverse transcriptase/retrotransposon-derived protein RNase H-like domain-containing protein n=1 Tax=Pisum sativum TaxID=3888 RepID=A0A9D4VZD2_PEA|nr:hypothetical protein KIW84_076932 [Pisum sativum]
MLSRNNGWRGSLLGSLGKSTQADPIDHLTMQQHKELQVVLRKHEAVFAEVVGLPLNRGREHAINIKVGEGPINGVAVDPNKYNSVLNWPVPRNVKGVRGFLGLTDYYRKFIRDYGKLAKPLTELTKKDVFQWGKDAQRAFDLLKQKLIAAPILALPNFEKEFVIECDASGTGLGANLSQEKKPIAYFSKSLDVRNLAKSAYEKELMACVLAIQHWRLYLLGRKFVVSTDQRSLKDLLQQKIISGEQQNWVAKRLGFNFEIRYKPGRMNQGANPLSRLHEGGEFNNYVSFPCWDEVQQVNLEIQLDDKLKKVYAEVEADPAAHPGYSVYQGTLLYKQRLVLSPQSVLIPRMLQEFHSSPQG